MFILPGTPSVELSTSPSPVELVARQVTTTTVAANANGGQLVGGCGGQYSGGTLAGAIVGTFLGTLLLVFLWGAISGPVRGSQEVVVERKVRRHRSHSGSSSVRRPSRVYSVRS